MIPSFLFKDGSLDGRYTCFAGVFFAGISSEGNLYPCHEMTALPNEPLGNLLTDDFFEIWNSSDLLRVRRYFRLGGRCDCWMDRFEPSVCLQKFLFPAVKLLRIFNNDKKKKI